MIQGKSEPRNPFNIFSRKLGYVVTIVVNVLLMILASVIIPQWNWSIIVDSQFQEWLPYFYLAAGVNILTSLLLLRFDPFRLRALMEIVANAFSMLAMLMLIAIFPFDLGDQSLVDLVKFSLWLGVLGVATAMAMDMKSVIMGERPQVGKGKNKNQEHAPDGLALN